MSRRVTMTEIARKAGVSVMTVSRALRGHPAMLPETRNRIRKLATSLGYRPDPTVSKLMSHLRVNRIAGPQVIAWLTSHPTRDGWRKNEACLSNHAGAVAQAERLGYKLEEFWLGEPGMTARRMSAVLRARGIRGILVAPRYEVGSLADLEWGFFAGATCGAYSMVTPHLHRACSHHFQAVKLACDALAGRGYRRIGLALPAENDRRVSGLWLASFLLEQRTRPAVCGVSPMVAADWGEVAFMKWYREYRPDVILSFQPAYHWLLAAGVDVPGECGFAVIDIAEPGFACVDERREDVGGASIDLIVEQLNTNRFGIPPWPKIVLVECGWRDGPTAPGPVLAKQTALDVCREPAALPAF
ncbi:transcriptional regulator [Opitutaceae bacterium TAV1]|nr:transcriptional regulator [Opitutaceae bacterium TAV1]